MYEYAVALVAENAPDGSPKTAREIEEEAVRLFEGHVGDGPYDRYDFYRPASYGEDDPGTFADLTVRHELFESAARPEGVEVYSARDLKGRVYFGAAVTPDGKLHRFDVFELPDWEELGECDDCLVVSFLAHW